MLIEFKVKNFKSIKDELVFSMEKGEGTRTTAKTKGNVFNIDSKHSLLKSALIFGANASGKSNFLEALFTLNMLVVRETRTVVEKLTYDGYGQENQPTEFEISFRKNGTTYTYEISYDSSMVLTEILKANSKLIFDRKKTEIKELRKNQTLLFYYQGINQKEASEVYSWFAEDLIFEGENFSVSNSILFSRLKDSAIKEKFLKILKYADFNIIDVDLLEMPADRRLLDFANEHFEDEIRKERFINRNREVTLNFMHENEAGERFTLVLRRESLGTQTAVKFILMMLSYDSNKVLLFDEFDTSFHLNLSKTFLSLINSEFQHSQFILTTHEIELMNHDMRKDQIYFMEKDAGGVSSMYSLYDFKQTETRNDASYSKKYLAGRFGGLPVIDKEAILSVLGEGIDGKKI